MGKKLNEEPCPKCRKPVNASASRCPHCHADYSPEEIAARQKQNKQAFAFGCAGLFALVLLIGWCAPEVPEPADDATETASIVKLVGKKTARAKTDIKAQFTTLYRRALDIGSDCDAANTVVNNALTDLSSGAADVYTTYNKANSAESICSDAVSKYGALSVGVAFSDEIKSVLRDSIDRCEAGYKARVSGLGTVKRVIDGDARPSLVQSFQDDQQRAYSAVTLCVAGFSAAGLKVGMTVKELEQLAE